MGAEVAGAVVALVATVVAIVVTARELAARRGVEARLAALSTLTDPALGRLDADALFAEVLERGRVAVGADAGWLHLVAGDELVRRSWRGQEVHAPLSLLETVAGRGDPTLRNDVADDGDDRAGAGAGAIGKSLLASPVLVEGEVQGVVSFVAARRGAFATDDLRTARQVAERFGWALQSERFAGAASEIREELAEAEHRVRTMVEAAPVGIVETTTAGEVERWNRTAADLLAWPRWLPGVTPPADRPLPEETAAAIEVAAGGRRGAGLFIAVPRPGTRTVQLQVSSSPVTDRQGDVDGVLLLLDDVTDRQQLEQHIRQSQRLGALARLAGVVAHDFNNLLTVIRGYSEVLAKSMDADDERRADIDAILEAAQRAAELTKQLLAIGRRPQQEPEVLDLHAAVRTLEPVLGRLAGEEIDLRVVTGAGPGPVRVDAGDLDQAVMNLVNNARDALAGPGRIMVETRAIELGSRGASLAGVTAGRYVMVTVADTGPGMPPEVLEHCFDPFFTTKERGHGTGLGLAAVYGTATQAGGHATVQSEVGRGTTVRLWLPFVDAETGSAPATSGRGGSRRRRGPAVPGGKYRVLLVEDEAPVRTLARASLEEAGYELLDVASAEDALVRLDAEREPIDVLVSDVMLGGLRGDDLAARLRKRQPRLCVVLVSGYTRGGLRMEPDAFLAKPFALDELTALVQGLTEGVPRARSGTRRRARS